MNKVLTSALVASNVGLAAVVCFFVFQDRHSGTDAPGSTPAGSGPSGLSEPLDAINKSVTRQSEAILRMNTTLVQYDFLQREIERLGRLDQALISRASAVAEARTEKNAADSDKTLAKIREIQQQVQTELMRRKETLLKLISGLEKNLAASTVDEQAVKEVLKPSPGEAPTEASRTESPPAAESGKP